MTCRPCAIALILIWPLTAAGQEPPKSTAQPSAETVPTEAELRDRLKDQEKRIEELERQIRSGPARAPGAPLPSAFQQPTTPTPPSPPSPGPPSPPPPLDANQKSVEWMKWNEVSALGSRFKLYGWLRLDAIYDDSRPNNTQVIGFVRSEDPGAIEAFRANPGAFGGVNPETFASNYNEDDFTLHPRLTRFGLDFDGPVVAALGDSKVTGKVEIDFYNNALVGQTESREAIRMRHAYLKLAWNYPTNGTLSLLAGQTNDVISPIYPIVNPDLVMWGAGNLGDRRPQLRPEYAQQVGVGKVLLQGEVGLTGANDNQDLDAPNTYGAGTRDGEASGRPTFQGRLAYNRPVFNKKASFEAGVYLHRAWEETDQNFGGHRMFDSWAYGLDATVPLFRDVLWVKGEAWTGVNVDDIRGGIFQGINRTTGEEIESTGGWVEIGFKPAKIYVLSIGYSTDDPDNSQVGLGGRAFNRIPYLSNRFYIDPIEFGFDYLHWTTNYVGFNDGVDNRFQAYISYKF